MTKIAKMVKLAVFEAENLLQMGLNLRKFREKNLSIQPFFFFFFFFFE